MLIPKTIDNEEILVRFVFLDNFKRKELKEEKINSQDIFLDTRLAGVSLQRGCYASEKNCKKYALSILNKSFVGFVLFRKKDFEQIVIDYKLERDVFESVLEFTPLNSDNYYLIDRDNSRVSDNGNPSHSDILYLNPAPKLDEPTPNTSLRLFSKKLMSKCKILLDANSGDNDYNGMGFIKFMAS